MTAPAIATGTNPGIEGFAKRCDALADVLDDLVGHEEKNPGLGMLLNIGADFDSVYADLLPT